MNSCFHPLPTLPPFPFPKPLLRFPLKPTTKLLPTFAANNQQQSNLGIPTNEVKTLAKFKSLHNDIKVLEVSRKADHPFAGSRLLLLDTPGNIHSISFLFKPFTSTYFDVFATLPPILPPGPIAILGFGAGSAARLLLYLYDPQCDIHGYELDPSVIAVANEYFGLTKLQNQYKNKLHVYVANALDAEIEGNYSGILVDLFSKGCVIPELQEVETWRKLKRRLRGGGRVMVNCGGRCVESEDRGRDGEVVMEETLKAMGEVFDDRGVFVMRLGSGKEDSCVAMTGRLPELEEWKGKLVKGLRGYVDMWTPLHGLHG